MTEAGRATDGDQVPVAAEAVGAATLGPLEPLHKPFAEAQRLPDSVLNAYPDLRPLQVQLLHNRTIARAEWARWLMPDWRIAPPGIAELPAVRDAIERLNTAVTQHQRIAVFGDHDNDGITSAAILTRALRALAADVTPVVPSRDDDGRGLNAVAVETLRRQGIQLIVTTDCGTANRDEIAQACAGGLDVIVTDHHPRHDEDLPAAVAVVNPSVCGHPAFDVHLSGAGVAFRLAEALLLTRAPERAMGLLESLLDLVAVGTVGDVVPLSPGNHALVAAGLNRLRTAPQPGLRALISRASLVQADITERDISFALAPRLNAGPRMGQPDVSLKLLLTDDQVQADQLAGELDELNRQRQADLERYLREARDQAQRIGDRNVTIVTGDGWPFGLTGLIAGRLADDYRRPAFALSLRDGEYRGSARGPEGINLGEILAAQAALFRRFGGHARAAGFTIEATRLQELLTHLEGQSWVRDAAREESAISVDCELPLDRVNEEYSTLIRQLGPFGPAFAEPAFLARGVSITRCWRTGQDGRNLRVALRQKARGRLVVVSGLLPRMGEAYDSVQAWIARPHHLDVAYSFSVYRRRDGLLDVSVRILGLRPSIQ